MRKKSQTGSILAIFAIVVTATLVGLVSWVLLHNFVFKQPAPEATQEITANTEKPSESYKGERVTLAGNLSIKVPNGWPAKVTDVNDSIKIIMFAGPNELPNLVYDPAAKPVISRLEAMGWDGLTQHFYIVVPQTEDSRFIPQPDDQKSTFVLDDGTEGERYLRIIEPSDDELSTVPEGVEQWQGRTHIFTKNGKTIEAHLATFAPTKLNITLFESVVRSIIIE